jgi:hypothetical protein
VQEIGLHLSLTVQFSAIESPLWHTDADGGPSPLKDRAQCGFIDVRYPSIATKFRIATKMMRRAKTGSAAFNY